MAKSPLEEHIEAIKGDKDFMSVLALQSNTDMVVQGDYSLEYWVQTPDELAQGETEICTVQELLKCLASEKE